MAGINKLANALQGRMKDFSKAPQILDFGHVNGNLSIDTNLFPITISKEDYVLCRHVRNLKAGDTVLVAWVDADLVVIDKVVTE